MKQRARLVIGLVVSLAFALWAVRGVQWGEFWRSVRGANYVYLAPAAIVIYAVSWVRAYRWRLLMQSVDLPLARVFRWVNIGYLFNNILPAKAGEVVRGYLSGRVIAGGFGKAASALLIERLLDVLSVVVLLGILVLVVPAVPDWVTRGGLLFGGVAVAGTAILVVLSRFGERGIDWLWRLVRRVPVIGSEGVRRALVNLLDGFSVLTAWRLLPGILAGTALVWLGYAVFNYVIFLSFGMLSLPFSAATLVLGATGVAMVLPSSPGAIGVFESAGKAALVLYAVGESEALSAMLVLHLFTNLLLIVLGLVGLGAEGLSWGGLRREALLPGNDAQVQAP